MLFISLIIGTSRLGILAVMDAMLFALSDMPQQHTCYAVVPDGEQPLEHPSDEIVAESSADDPDALDHMRLDDDGCPNQPLDNGGGLLWD